MKEDRQYLSSFFLYSLMPSLVTFFLFTKNLASLGFVSSISVRARVEETPKRKKVDNMAREFAESFYKSQAWKRCRASYVKSVGGLCENCLKKGLYKPGQIVHHICHISEENINDTTVTLDWNNLRLVCRECHAQEHSTEGRRRYKIDEFGNVIVRED